MEDVAVVVDAKYKRHWEELQEHGWQGQEKISENSIAPTCCRS
jgi:broad-specificity NMP kinase